MSNPSPPLLQSNVKRGIKCTKIQKRRLPILIPGEIFSVHQEGSPNFETSFGHCLLAALLRITPVLLESAISGW